MRSTFLCLNRVWSPTHSQFPRKYISIGGWCGPALILGKLGLRTEAYPFDFSRCTLDGLIHFIKNGFHDGFYPPGPPYKPECVGIWILYRGKHTAFAHFDLNDAKVQDHFKRKMKRWDDLFDAPKSPVTFFRTVTSRNPIDEIALVSELEETIEKRNPQLDFRIVFVVHDQGLRSRAVELAALSPRVTLWVLGYTEDDKHVLFDRSQKAYADIVWHSVDESNWPAQKGVINRPVGITELEGDVHAETLSLLRDDGHSSVAFKDLCVSRFPWRSHDNLALIDGVASVGGTCTGIGSTKCVDGCCAYCGNNDFHKAGAPMISGRPFTEEEDQLLIAHLYMILTGDDKVEAVERLAHEMKRGTYEIICRIQFLTDSTTKLKETLYIE